MKRARIDIRETYNQNQRYNIYRFKNEPAKTNLEYYLDIDPITILDETDNNKPHEYGEFDSYTPFVSDKGEEYKFISYSAPFDFVFRDDFVVFKIGKNNANKYDKLIEIYISKVGIGRFVYKELKDGLYVTKLETTDISEIRNHAEIVSSSCINLSRVYTDGYLQDDIKLRISTNRLFYIDQESNGVFIPEYKVVERLKDYEIHPIEVQGNIYHYTAISTDIYSKTSDVSNIASVLIKENPNDVNMYVECSDNYHSGIKSWKRIDKIKASNVYRIEKNDMFSRIIPLFNSTEIKADDTNVQVYNERVLKVPNIWHKDKSSLSYRKLRAYRFVNEMNGEYSERSDIFYKDDYFKVNIDKMVIYKKNVTRMATKEEKIAPIHVDDKDAEILKICIRLGGKYYKEAIQDIDNQPIEVFTIDSRFPIISIKDHCLYSNEYNYTVYLYDEKGYVSNPISIVL